VEAWRTAAAVVAKPAATARAVTELRRPLATSAQRQAAAAPAVAAAATGAVANLQAGGTASDLQVASGTAQGRLAGAVAARLRAETPAVLSAMGPQAAYTAIRAIAIAGDYLRRERPRQELAVTVERTSSGKDAEGLEMFRLRLNVRLEPKEEKEAEEREVRVAQGTNIGHVASFLARALGESRGVPAIRGMGAAATSQALKAAAIAQGYVQRDLGGELVFTPRVARILTGASEPSEASRAGSSEQRKRSMEMVLRCRCIGPPSKKASAISS